MEDVRDTKKRRLRVRIFVDNANLEGDADQYTKQRKQNEFRMDWKKFPNVLVSKVASLIDNDAIGMYSGLNVYASYDPRYDNEIRKRDWFLRRLTLEPGVRVGMFTRTMPREENGQTTDGSKSRYREKGLDCRMAIDVVVGAMCGEPNSYDVAAIVSSDTDFVPAVSDVSALGKLVVHVGFPDFGNTLASHCWGRIDITEIWDEFRTPPKECQQRENRNNGIGDESSKTSRGSQIIVTHSSSGRSSRESIIQDY